MTALRTPSDRRSFADHPGGNPTPAGPTVVTTRPSPLTYAIRRIVTALVLVALVAGVAVAATGRLPSVLSAGAPLERGDEGLGSSAPAADPAADRAADPASAPVDPAARETEPAAGSTTEPEPAPAPAAAPEPTPVADPPSEGSRLVAQAPERVLDTRAGDAGPPARGTTHAVELAPDRRAVALSVSVMMTAQAGSVLVDGGDGTVEAIAVGGPGATVTNLVIVPVVTDELAITSTAGGHLVVDVVGTFRPVTGGSAGGRFVPIEPTRVTEMVTATDGREAVVTFDAAVPVGPERATAVLAMITADVGSDGGIVRLGPAAEAYDQMLMWGPASGDARTRRGIVLLQPGEETTAALRYDGGTALSVDVLGYFTDESAGIATAGLFVTDGPSTVFAGQLEADSPVVLRDVAPADGLGVATVADRTGTGGRLWTETAPVTGGEIVVTSSAPIEAEVTLLGVFRGSEP